MNPEKQRIAIAEACGLIVCPRCLNEIDPDTCRYKGTIPDYLNNLNAMHEAEKTLTADQWMEYERELMRRCEYSGLSFASTVIHTTASQRAEAFLRTIGKWEDE